MFAITGATGHIGNNLLRLMLASGDDVRILLRRAGPAIAGLAVDAAYGDIFDPAFLADHLAAGDVLIHLAALIDLSGKQADETLRVNYEGTRRIADFCASRGVRLVFVSSVDAIDRPRDNHPIREPESFEPVAGQSDYARSKALATAYVAGLLASGKLTGCILYPAAVIGPHDYKPSAAGREIVRALSLRIAFTVRGGYDFIDVRDVALAIRRAAVTGYDGACILAAHPASVTDLYRAIAKARGRSMVLLPVPRVLVRIGGLFMKEFSRPMLDALFANAVCDATRMRRDLSVEPRPFAETVADTVAWFQNR